MKKLTEAYANFYLPEESRQLIISKLKNALKEELGAWYGYTIVREWLTGMHTTCEFEVIGANGTSYGKVKLEDKGLDGDDGRPVDGFGAWD